MPSMRRSRNRRRRGASRVGPFIPADIPTLFRIRGQFLFELGARTVEPAHHRTDFHTLLVSHLLVGFAVNRSVNEHLPTFRTELVQRRHDFFGSVRVKILLFG